MDVGNTPPSPLIHSETQGPQGCRCSRHLCTLSITPELCIQPSCPEPLWAIPPCGFVLSRSLCHPVGAEPLVGPPAAPQACARADRAEAGRATWFGCRLHAVPAADAVGLGTVGKRRWEHKQGAHWERRGIQMKGSGLSLIMPSPLERSTHLFTEALGSLPLFTGAPAPSTPLGDLPPETPPRSTLPASLFPECDHYLRHIIRWVSSSLVSLPAAGGPHGARPWFGHPAASPVPIRRRLSINTA